MKRFSYFLMSFLLVCALFGCMHAEKSAGVWTNMYDSNCFQADSLNDIFAERNWPMKFTGYDLHICDKYRLCLDTISWGFSIERIEDRNMFYAICVPEYLVGYTCWFFLDKQTDSLYRTGPVDIQGVGHEPLYETCNFQDKSISILYADSGKVERVALQACERGAISMCP